MKYITKSETVKLQNIRITNYKNMDYNEISFNINYHSVRLNFTCRKSNWYPVRSYASIYPAEEYDDPFTDSKREILNYLNKIYYGSKS